MNPANSFVNWFVLRGEDGSVRRLRIPSLVLLVLVVILAALGVYLRISASDNLASAVVAPGLSENPELALVHRFGEINVNAPEFSILAANPELKYANRYREAAKLRMDALFMASNPELSLHQRFVYEVKQAAANAFLYENPEVRLHQRFVEMTRESQEARFLAENPEINTVRHYESLEK